MTKNWTGQRRPTIATTTFTTFFHTQSCYPQGRIEKVKLQSKLKYYKASYYNWPDLSVYFTRLEITCDPCNLIACLSGVWFVHELHYFFLWITSALNRVIPVLNRTVFALYGVVSISCTKWDVKAFSFQLFNKIDKINFGTVWILRFQTGCNKMVVELPVLQFWSEIVLWFQIELTLRVRPILKSRVWFQTKLNST